jgi:hypothetical protein
MARYHVRMAVAEVLARAGVRITEEEFARLVDAVLAEVGPAALDDPASGLTAQEASALSAVGADLRPRGRRERDPRADVAASYAAVLAATESVAEVSRRLGIDGSRVRHRLARRQLVGNRRNDGWRLPSWQFGVDGRPLPGLERVLRALDEDVHPVVLARFFATTAPELRVGRRAVTPREWLVGGGDPAPVAALARGLAFAG